MPYAEEIIRGFRCGRSTTDQVSTMRQIFEKCWENNVEINCLFMDFKSPYDSLFRKKMR
jgi:hypothetical protein